MNRLVVIVLLVHVAKFYGVSRDVEELSVYYKKEVVDDLVFVYREDVANGVRKQVWSIDGKSVDYEQFEDALLEAEKSARRVERRKKMERRKKNQENLSIAATELYKKLLRLFIVEIEDMLQKFDDHRLVPFLTFNQLFSKQEFESIEKELLPEAKSILYSDDSKDIGALSEMVAKLESLPERLDDFFHITVNEAIKLCDDTRMLKDLLGVISINS